MKLLKMTENYDNLTATNNKNNSTTFSISHTRWQHWNWIVPVTINSIFIAMTFWILRRQIEDVGTQKSKKL